jgi:PKD repeat protein
MNVMVKGMYYASGRKGSVPVSRFLIIFLILFSEPFAVLSLYGQDARGLKVKKGHPVLFVTPEMVTGIRKKTDDLQRFHVYVKQSREKFTNDPEDTVRIRKEVDEKTLKGHVDYYINDCMCYGVDAYINQHPLSKSYARQYVLSLLSRPISGDDDMPIRGKLFALGVLYDFLYEELEPSLKKEIRNEILDMVKYVDSKWHYISHANAGGHSRFGNISALVGLLPIYHDIEEDNADRYYKYLGYVVSNWENIFNPLQEWVNGGGSHSMGWAYGASYSTLYPYMVWEFATDEESWLKEWQREKAYFNLYGLRNDYNENERSKGAYDNFPFWEDVWSSEYSPNLQGMQVLFSAGYYGDRHAQWFYNHMKKRNLHGWMFDDNPWDILYNNFSENDGLPPDDLPLSRQFLHSGFVLMRDSWDFQKNTLMVFKSSSFYAAGHHHKDQNAFTIYYKGPLAIDAGTYEASGGWGSTHFWNYYTRTVAHNSILVYKPYEYFNGYSNDGGQRFFPIDDPYYHDVIEGGANHLDGILRYENNKDYTFSMGDATKAYRSTKLELFTRSVVYLRGYSGDHPAMIVYDKVIAKDSSYKKTYLLHSIKKPAVDSTLVTITIDDGLSASNKAVLYQRTLLPENALLVRIGGRENHQQYYVADDGHGNPHNYEEGTDYNTSSERKQREIREGGDWRVEVSPPDSTRETEFLHVLSVADGNGGEKPVPAKYIASENMDGVLLRDTEGNKTTLVLFCRDTLALDDSLELPAGTVWQHVLITGLKRNAGYMIGTYDKGIYIRNTGAGNVKSSDQGSLWLNDRLQPVLAHISAHVNTCNGEVRFSARATRSDVSAWHWDFGDGSGADVQEPVHRYDTAGTYHVRMVAAAGLLSDTCEQEVVVPPAIEMPVVTEAVRCGPGTLTLTAKSGEGVLKWFDDPRGGTFLAVGDTFVTPPLDETKVYYVASVLPGKADTVFGAKKDTSGAGGYYPWDDEAAVRGLIFDVNKYILIKSVKVYNDTGQAATRTITVTDAGGNIVATRDVYIPEGESRIVLDFPVVPGKDYFLKAADPHKGLYRNTSGATYPYYVGDAVTITRSDVGTEGYYFFYDWEVVVSGDSAGCRTAARAVITPAPQASFRYQIYDTVVYFTNNSKGESYRWDFGDGMISSEKDPVHSYENEGDYPVRLVVTNGCGVDTVTDTLVIEKESHTGVPEMIPEQVGIICYPNPARDLVTFRCGVRQGTQATLYLYNSSGHLVRMLKVPDLRFFRIPVSGMPAGVYFLKAVTRDNRMPQPVRFVIMR